MEPFETYEHAGVTVELHYDETPFNPRTDRDNAGTIIVSFTRELDGDEYLSVGEDLTIDCPSCEGSGESTERYHLERLESYGWVTIGAGTWESMEGELNAITSKPAYALVSAEVAANHRPMPGMVRVEAARCPRCDGEETIRATVAASELRARIEDAEVVIPLRFSDYGSSGSDLGETDDDNANAAIYCTAETLQKEWDGDREKCRKCMEAEVEEYSSWLTGEVYGYVIKGPDGEDLPGSMQDSCWGFIGEKYVREQANEAAEGVAESLTKEKTERDEMAARDIETVES